MIGRQESHVERQWPRATDESKAREAHAAEWQRYDFAASLVSNARVMDCACGAGYGSALLARAGAAKVVGVDVSGDALSWARAEFSIDGRTEFRLATADELPISDGEFDVVVSLETVEHVSAEAAPKFIRTLARALRPAGKLILSTPINHGPDRFHPENPFHLREYTPAELGALLSPHFSIEQRLGQHSIASKKFADLGRAPGIGAIVRSGLHRLVPKVFRRLVRDALIAPNTTNRDCWISAERWEEAAVQIVVAQKK